MPDIRPIESRLQRIINTFACGAIGGALGSAITGVVMTLAGYHWELWMAVSVPLTGVVTSFIEDWAARRAERKLLPVARVL